MGRLGQNWRNAWRILRSAWLNSLCTRQRLIDQRRAWLDASSHILLNEHLVLQLCLLSGILGKTWSCLNLLNLHRIFGSQIRKVWGGKCFIDIRWISTWASIPSHCRVLLWLWWFGSKHSRFSSISQHVLLSHSSSIESFSSTRTIEEVSVHMLLALSDVYLLLPQSLLFSRFDWALVFNWRWWLFWIVLELIGSTSSLSCRSNSKIGIKIFILCIWLICLIEL